MAGKLLKIISPDKIENRDAENYKQALDLSPGDRGLHMPLICASFFDRMGQLIGELEETKQ